MREVIALLGGPYNLHVFTLRPPLLGEVRFPAEPAKDVRGRPSVCAPVPSADGPHRYVWGGERNFLGHPTYRYAEPEGAL